jgi:short-subunit dehydrogenase
MGGVPGGGTVTEGMADRREVATMDRQSITAFLAQPNLALVGASRGGQGFGNVLPREQHRRGVRVLRSTPGSTRSPESGARGAWASWERR